MSSTPFTQRITTLALALLTWGVASACSESAPPLVNDPRPDVPVQRSVFNLFGQLTELSYQEIDGLRIHQGDIVLPEPVAGVGGQAKTALAAITSTYYWPKNQVAYVVDGSLPNQQRVFDAMRHIEDRTFVRFVQRTSEASFVRIIPDSRGCLAHIGRQSGETNVWLADGCTTGNTIHELLHTLGIWHEQSRQDRDDHVTVRYENISAGLESQFDKYPFGRDVRGYDISSIMHYGSYAFSRNGQPTITRKDGSTFDAQRSGLTAGDTEGLREIYPEYVNPPAPPPILIEPAIFDVTFYLAVNPDLGSDPQFAQNHWVSSGIYEGRKSAPWFDVQFYLAVNPDLQAVFGTDYEGAAKHWIASGLYEGRRASPAFMTGEYLANNPDLLAAFGPGNFAAALSHWATSGIAEGRGASDIFQPTYYLARHTDLAGVFGQDYRAAMQHWSFVGLTEGRGASPLFDATAYLNRYPDLLAALGPNFRQALIHWLTIGRYEGRNAAP